MPPLDSENEGRTLRWPLKGRHRYLRAFAWVMLALALVPLACFGILIALLNSKAGHDYLLNQAQRQAAEAVGVPVRLENFALHLSTLTLDVYGVRIAGMGPNTGPPLLQADHLRVGIRVVSTLSHSWYLSDVQIDHPVAWIVVDKDGLSNLPVFKNTGSDQANLFDLGIRRVQISRGEIFYNARPYALKADLHDLAFNSTFDSLLRRYNGRLSYANGVLKIGTFQPLAHNFDSEFEASPTAFTLKRGSIAVGSSRASLQATIVGYSNPTVRAQYQILLDGHEAAQILNEPALPAGTIQSTGTLQYHALADRSVLQSFGITGGLSSAKLAFKSNAARAAITNFAANYSLHDGNLTFKDIHADALGGNLSGEGSMKAVAGDSHSSFHLTLRKVSLAAVEQSMESSGAFRNVGLTGTADLTATATWRRSINDLIARADLSLDGLAMRQSTTPQLKRVPSNVQSSGPERAGVPIQGSLHAMYLNENRSLTLTNSFLRSSQTDVQLNGTIGRQSSLAVDLRASDLAEIARFVDAFRAPGKNTPAINLRGEASFLGNVKGSVASPEISGQISARNVDYDGIQWRHINGRVQLSPTIASLQTLHMEAADHGSITGNASVELRDWSFHRDSKVQLDLAASGISTQTIAQLAAQPIPISGSLSVNAHLRGAAFTPTGTANIRLTGATVYGEPLNQVTADLSGSGNEIKGSASILSPAGLLQLQFATNPISKTYKGQVTSTGVDLAKLQTIKARGIDAKGVLALRASGQGSYDDPALNANLEIPSLTINGESISQAKLQVNQSHHTADFELTAKAADAPIHGKARVGLQGDYLVDGSLDTPTVSLEPLLAAYAPSIDSNLSGQVEMHATIHGPIKNKNQLQAHVKVPVLQLAYGNSIQLASSPIEADYQDGLFRLQPMVLKGPDTELNIQGAFPIGSPEQASLQALGTVDLRVLQLFDSDLRTSGQLRVHVDSRGANTASLLAGEVDISDAGVSTTTSPVGLQHANGVLRLTGDRLTVERLEGTLGGGPITAQGAIIFRPDLQFNLGAAIHDAQLLYPQGVRETANANLRLTGSMKHATLGGAVTLSNLSFTPAFDLSSAVAQLSGGVEAPASGGFQQDLSLNIGLNSTNDASLVSRTLSVNGTANLQIRGTAAQPVVLGRVNLTGGDVILNGNRFVLNGGTVQFVNPAMTEPVLNVALSTKIQEYDIDLHFRGPTEQLRTQYTSNPSLPPADIINLLAFGQTTEASAMNSTPMNQQAEGLVASQVAGQVTSRISKAAGISQLSISPVIAGGTAAGPPGANLTIQQRVTGNLFVTFSTNVSTTQGQTIQGQYQVSPHVTVSATRDPNGGFAVDTLIKKSW